MSIKLTAKAWETNQSGNDLLVLLALCDFSNDEGVSFPSLKTLLSKAKVSKTTLSYILRAYEDIGVITRERRTRDNKSDTSTLYKINHLNIDANAYQKAYQKARNYISKNDESPQCEHPTKDKIVNTGSEIVNTLTANCEHLEPSSINHQVINQEERRENNSNLTNAKKETAPLSFSKNENTKSEINPKEIIEAYKNRISNKHSDIQEPTSFNIITQHSNEFKQILTGIMNYGKSLKHSNKKPEKLFFFIRNKIYLDYQVETVEQQDINPGIKSSGPYQSKADRTKNFMNNYYARKAKALESDNQIIDAEVIS